MGSRHSACSAEAECRGSFVLLFVSHSPAGRGTVFIKLEKPTLQPFMSSVTLTLRHKQQYFCHTLHVGDVIVTKITSSQKVRVKWTTMTNNKKTS
jgi:hypothetical protein